MKAYCLACRKKVEVEPNQARHTKHGRYVFTGVCPNCGRRVGGINQQSRRKPDDE